AKEALARNESIADLVVEHGLVEREQLGEILKPERLTGMPADDNVTTDPDSAESVPRDEMTGELPVVADPEERPRADCHQGLLEGHSPADARPRARVFLGEFVQCSVQERRGRIAAQLSHSCAERKRQDSASEVSDRSRGRVIREP